MSPHSIRRTTVALEGDGGEPISCDVHRRNDAADSPDAPVVVICHSFMAFREWGFFPHVARQVAEGGFTAVSFDFSRNGVARGGDRITEFDRFASNSFSRELSDLRRVVAAVREGALPVGGGEGGSDRPGPPVALLGHSRGGGIAISHASRDPGIAALVSWSAISTFDRWTEHQKRGWRERGFLPLSGPGGEGPLRLGVEILKDVETRLPEIDPVVRAPYITAPWLIVHGRADVTVPVREAESLAGAAGPGRAELRILDAVGHLYNARTPDEDHYLTLNQIISLTLDWVRGAIA